MVGCLLTAPADDEDASQAMCVSCRDQVSFWSPKLRILGLGDSIEVYTLLGRALNWREGLEGPGSQPGCRAPSGGAT
jgi:hypothetical protein